MIAGLILAAGASRRMGRPKSLLPIGRDCFASRLVLTFARAGIDRIVVVGAAEAGVIRSMLHDAGLAADVVVNPRPDDGQLSSLRIGLAALAPHEPGAIAVSPVDVPLVAADTVRALVRAWRESHAPVVRPVHGGRHGHPVIFDRSVFGELERADLAVGAKAVVRAHATEAVDVAVDDEGAFLDIDTPEDYARLIGSASGT
jgi:molybdenum cofactor cytidylyltransferase